MKKLITLLPFLAVINLCYSQSSDKNRIYATQFRGDISLDNQLNIKVKKLLNSTIYILETNDDNEITRELTRMSDSTFLYTEYYPMVFEKYLKLHGNNGIYKQGTLVLSSETVLDSTIMWNPETFETFPSPRKLTVLKQTGEWIEKYSENGRHNKIVGCYNASGKNGEWKYYSNKGELDKVQTYKKGTLVKEDYSNLLNFQSIEKTSKIMIKTWAYSYHYNKLSTNIDEETNTYQFEEDGTFTSTYFYPKKVKSNNDFVQIRKGKWSLIDYKTIEFTTKHRKKVLELEYLSEKIVRFNVIQ